MVGLASGPSMLVIHQGNVPRRDFPLWNRVMSKRKPQRNVGSVAGIHSLTVWLLVTLPAICPAADWPQYRGPNHDGILASQINTQWTETVTTPIWLVPVTNSL